MVNKILIKFNRHLMTAWSHLTAMDGELGVTISTLHHLLSRLTMLWSSFILITSYIKLSRRVSQKQEPLVHYYVSGNSSKQLSQFSSSSFLSPNLSPNSTTNGEGSEEAFQWNELLLLDYLPGIDSQTAKLYYKPVILIVALTLGWRFYLAFIHQHCLGVWRTFDRDQVNIKRAVFKFFNAGPSYSPETDAYVRRLIEEHVTVGASDMEAMELVPTRRNLLSQMHERRHYDWRATGQVRQSRQQFGSQDSTQSGEESDTEEATTSGAGRANIDDFPAMRMYRNPIRDVDHLYDQSERRWCYLAKLVYAFTLFFVICSALFFYRPVIGLTNLNRRFGYSQRDFASTPTTTSGASRKLFVTFLMYYGVIEQVFVCCQMATFLATNVFVTLFHADIIYKARIIQDELRELAELYRRRLIDTTAPDQLRRHQLRIWSYFNQINCYDSFVSRFSVATLIALFGGLLFSQDYWLTDDKLLWSGTLAVLAYTALPFLYLSFLSGHIERQCISINRSIYIILARERKPELKREWQRIPRAFFLPDWNRTFTLAGQYPINFCTVFRELVERQLCNVELTEVVWEYNGDSTVVGLDQLV